MAKLGGSSCRPLMQGMMLLALLLLASIQAGPVMAQVTDLAHGGEEVLEKGKDYLKNKFGFLDGAKAGYKIHKYSCKALGWMDNLNTGPGGASGTPSFVDIGDLSRSFGTFSYYVNVKNFCPQQTLVPAVGGTRSSTTLFPSRYPNDGRYYVQMTGVRVVGVSHEVVRLRPTLNLPLYLSTAPYTYLERSVYKNLAAAVIRQMAALNPWATLASSPFTVDQLCYKQAAGLSLPLRLPSIAIQLASNNAAMGTTMELGGAAWHALPSMFCLGILPATMEGPFLGTMIQSGKTMTIDVAAPGRQGTLTRAF